MAMTMKAATTRKRMMTTTMIDVSANIKRGQPAPFYIWEQNFYSEIESGNAFQKNTKEAGEAEYMQGISVFLTVCIHLFYPIYLFFLKYINNTAVRTVRKRMILI